MALFWWQAGDGESCVRFHKSHPIISRENFYFVPLLVSFVTLISSMPSTPISARRALLLVKVHLELFLPWMLRGAHAAENREIFWCGLLLQCDQPLTASLCHLEYVFLFWLQSAAYVVRIRSTSGTRESALDIWDALVDKLKRNNDYSLTAHCV